jgi:hypothetical protein
VKLVKQAALLIPSHAQVIFHGDTEFGGVEMMRALRQLAGILSLLSVIMSISAKLGRRTDRHSIPCLSVHITLASLRMSICLPSNGLVPFKSLLSGKNSMTKMGSCGVKSAIWPLPFHSVAISDD